RETAACSAGGTNCFFRHPWTAAGARCLHRSANEKWEGDRNKAYHRARSTGKIQRGRSQSAVRCGDESACVVRWRKCVNGPYFISAWCSGEDRQRLARVRFIEEEPERF